MGFIVLQALQSMAIAMVPWKCRRVDFLEGKSSAAELKDHS